MNNDNQTIEQIAKNLLSEHTCEQCERLVYTIENNAICVDDSFKKTKEIYAPRESSCSKWKRRNRMTVPIQPLCNNNLAKF
jgi:hypothetical protein